MGFIWMNVLSGPEPSLHGTHTSLSTVQMQPGHASGTECLRCGWLLPCAPGSWGCSAAAYCLALKNAVLQREVTVTQDKKCPCSAQEEALGTALPQAQPATLGKEASQHFHSACADCLAALHSFSAARAAPRELLLPAGSKVEAAGAL